MSKKDQIIFNKADLTSSLPSSDGFFARHFLIATPAMEDPRFSGTVIYLCVHDAEHAMGIIINKPKPDLRLSQMLPHLDIKGDITGEDTQILYGGPVETERGFVLHSRDFIDDNNSLPLSDTMALTAHKSVLNALVRANAPQKAVLALGYAGWHAGQLDEEIQANAWLIAPADEDLIFTTPSADIRKMALLNMGITPEFLSMDAGHA
jgi:putative transcriptional regulator